MNKIKIVIKTAFILILFTASFITYAAYPDKPIKIIVPFAPGGGNDQLGRLIAEKLSKITSNAFIVENRGGAGGNLGAEFVARSTPDGYTLLMASNQVVINQSLYPKLNFDVMKDLTPVALLADVQFLLVANQKTNIKSLSDLILMDKKSPGTLNHGTPGTGTPQHLSAELFNSMAGTNLVHVPYKGTGPSLIDLLGGQIQLAFGTLPAVEPYVKSGRLTPIAVTGATRSSLLPQVPTISESGVKGYESSTWYGLIAPMGTPKSITNMLEKNINIAMNDPVFKEQLINLGFEPRFKTGSEMKDIIKMDYTKWANIIKETNVKID